MSFTLKGTATIEEICRKRAGTISLLEYANANRDSDLFNDVHICVGRHHFPANRLVLSCYSLFFEKMFKVEMKEKNQKQVIIESVDSDSMKSLIDFIYTGKIIISIDNVCNLLSSSDYLQIEEVKKFCFDFIHEAMTPENCFTVYGIADCYLDDDLKGKAIQLVAENFDETSKSVDFKNFTKTQLIGFVSKQDNKKIAMTSLYNAIVGWTMHDEEIRTNDFYDLFQLVQLQNLPSSFLEEVVTKEKLVVGNAFCAQMLLDALSKQLKESKLEKLGSRILSLGGSKTMSKVTEVYNCLGQQPKNYPDLLGGRYCGCSVRVNNFVYYIAGIEKMVNNPPGTTSVWRMNLTEQELKWQEVESMNHGWCGMGATVFDGNVVVAGGRLSSPVSAMYFSSIVSSWQELPSLNQQRFGNSLVQCNGCLYVLGGISTRAYLSSVECLLAGAGKWKYVRPMQIPRVWMAAVACNGYIYAMGGKCSDDADAIVGSVERYDATLGEWGYVSDMNVARASFSACVLQGKIFVVGGLDNGTIIREIECYDPLCDEWSIVGETEEDFYNHSLVVV